MKRECQRHARRAHPVPHRDARFGRPDEQHAVIGQTLVERADHAILRVAIEVDQHVPTEHEIVANAGIHGRFDEVGLTELHARAHALVEQPAVAGRREVPRAKLRRGAAERIAPVAAEPRLLDRARAEVDRVDREAGRIEPCVEQRHRRRIRLLAGRARRAQHADHPAGQRGDPFGREPHERREGLAVAEEPGLGHDEQLDQRTSFIGRRVELLPVGVERVLRHG
ncbi:hypothetical protein BLA6863_03095 [Burkholderia lata]|uniref:Uncharacterized protein n=1 Tax=Burkholderia lata (strain ATCC 17760 / DSM 23089 / LMG 22485 / NCIMB 9086 / R18194 / 383) TaxID=482957 RepID=A0A6P2LGU9_BURL3|nr:hypothetical protein BLA6863_03095 [Burkholderia lata]